MGSVVVGAVVVTLGAVVVTLGAVVVCFAAVVDDTDGFCVGAGADESVAFGDVPSVPRLLVSALPPQEIAVTRRKERSKRKKIFFMGMPLLGLVFYLKLLASGGKKGDGKRVKGGGRIGKEADSAALEGFVDHRAVGAVCRDAKLRSLGIDGDGEGVARILGRFLGKKNSLAVYDLIERLGAFRYRGKVVVVLVRSAEDEACTSTK